MMGPSPIRCDVKLALTGRTRIRVQWRWFRHPLPILQVEVRETYELRTWVGAEEGELREHVYWRDLRFSDLPGRMLNIGAWARPLEEQD